jgi:hypothetical protein
MTPQALLRENLGYVVKELEGLALRVVEVEGDATELASKKLTVTPGRPTIVFLSAEEVAARV